MMSYSSNKPMGGEYELPSEEKFYGITNSGRSSLRWSLESMGLRGKKILAPDFLCQIVIEVLNEYNVDVHYYPVNRDFSFELPDVDSLKEFDAIYVIRYFGSNTQSLINLLNSSPVNLILDDVFGIEPPHISNSIHWTYFNSLRKISPVADYSHLISNKPLAKVDIVNLDSFSISKYKAKNLKALFISKSQGMERDYLETFLNAESLLDNSKSIYSASSKSIVLASKFFSRIEVERDLREKNLLTAKGILPEDSFINISPDMPSFLPLVLHNRDSVRSYLMSKNIYLAIHWPPIVERTNSISEAILSLPLDSRYSVRDIKRACVLVREYGNVKR